MASPAQQRLGKSEEARRWLDKATAWLDQYRDGMPGSAEREVGLHLHNWLERTSSPRGRGDDSAGVSALGVSSFAQRPESMAIHVSLIITGKLMRERRWNC